MNQQRKDSSPADSGADVRDFYERYPYPRPIDDLQRYRELWQDHNRRRADHHLYWPAKSFRENHSVLVAGCGTSQAAKHAMRWPDAQVIGIDFSATSVRCTENLKQKYNLDNLEVHQLRIEDVGELDMQFDQIVCTGVLHHLPDPDAGLRALRRVLRPDGAMLLMLYAPYGRAGIYMLQDFCRRVGIPATDEGIDSLIATLKLLPPGHPLEHLLNEAPDFQTDAALADALLHPQDRSYSVPQLFDFIERTGQTFGRWIKQAHYSPHCGVLAQILQSSGMSRLSAMEQYAAVELFRGTMVVHSFIAYRNDSPSGPQAIRFDHDDWLRYIPIVTPDTVCIQERLPAGAAGVLINKSHTYRDLFLPIDSFEKTLHDAIDGSRTIGEIVHTASSKDKSQLERARNLFERLWWFDQVVFDTTLENA